MSAETYDLDVRAGTTFRRVFEWRDEAGGPIPLGTRRPRMQIRTSDDTVQLDSELADSGLVLTTPDDVGNNEVHLRIGATKTAVLKPGRYDIELYEPDDVDEVELLIEGAVHVGREVTR